MPPPHCTDGFHIRPHHVHTRLCMYYYRLSALARYCYQLYVARETCEAVYTSTVILSRLNRLPSLGSVLRRNLFPPNGAQPSPCQ